jgi:hypothetical protein
MEAAKFPVDDNPVSQDLANSGVLASLAIHWDNAAYATGAF